MTTTFQSRLGTYPTEGIKAPCVASTTVNNTLIGLQTFEANDRVLVRSQTDPLENGIYNVSSSEWSRASDFNTSEDVANGQLVLDSGPATPVLYVTVFTGDYSPGVTSVTFEPAITA